MHVMYARRRWIGQVEQVKAIQIFETGEKEIHAEEHRTGINNTHTDYLRSCFLAWKNKLLFELCSFLQTKPSSLMDKSTSHKNRTLNLGNLSHP